MIIGISGLAGSGKDTCADFLVRGGGFVKVSLADPIKRIARDMFEFTDEQLWGASEMRNAPDERYPRDHTLDGGHGLYKACSCCGLTYEWGTRPDSIVHCYLTPRYALQRLGTELGRHLYGPVWIECALRVAKKLEGGGWGYDPRSGITPDVDPRYRGGVAVPDIRFENEIAAFKEAGAKLIRIVRRGSGLVGAVGSHRSETEQTSVPDGAFDAVIVNEGTLEELEAKVLAFVGRRCELCGVSLPHDDLPAACGRCIVERR